MYIYIYKYNTYTIHIQYIYNSLFGPRPQQPCRPQQTLNGPQLGPHKGAQNGSLMDPKSGPKWSPNPSPTDPQIGARMSSYGDYVHERAHASNI